MRMYAHLVSVLVLCGPLLSGCASGELAAERAALAGLRPVTLIPAQAETPPVASGDDAADDPAIWVNPNDPAQSRILGTDKKAGLYVYDLKGAKVQSLPAGRLNNVDVRQNLSTETGTADLAVASNRSDNTVSVFGIDRATGVVSALASFPSEVEPYGICAADGRSQGGDGIIVAVAYKTGLVNIHRFMETGSPAVRLTASFKLSSQAEGCVFDEAQNAIFVGEEDVGLWRVDFSGTTPGTPVLVDRVGSGSGLIADVEGVGIWAGPGTAGYLVVSSQLADRFIVYERAAPNRLVFAFGVGANEPGTVDAVTHTDGLEVISAPLGPHFPFGALVVQDDANTEPGQTAPLAQNFKIVDWTSVVAARGRQ